MKASWGLILLLSFPAFAQRRDECPRPGLVLNTNYIGETSSTDTNIHRRIGGADIPLSASFVGGVRSQIYKNYRDQVCASEAYQFSEKICNRISPDVALGRGNQILRSLFDLNLSTLQRSENFQRNLKYQTGASSTDRFESSRQIISLLARQAAVKGIPRSFEEFSAMLQTGVAEGAISQFLVDDIITANGGANKRALGFVPMDGAIVRENAGNGRLQELFDLGITPEHRAKRIEKLITGVTPAIAKVLSRTIIVFASNNGIPSNWKQFAAMMKDARDTNNISDFDYRQVVIENEDVNRNALGFELNAEVCRIETSTRYSNVIRDVLRKVTDREVSRQYQIAVNNAPVVGGEEEVFTVVFDGFSEPVLNAPSRLNSYRISQTIDNGVIKFQLDGNRNKVRPSNSLVVKLKVDGKISTLNIQDTNFNSRVSSKVKVKVMFYNDRFLASSKLLGTETYELTDGSLRTIVAAIRDKKVDFVKVFMMYENSPYYSDEYSDEIKAKD